MRPILVGLLLLCAAIGNSWGESQGPAPSAGNADSQAPTKSESSQQPSTNDQRGTEQSPFIVKIIGTEPQAQNGGANKRQDDQDKSWDWGVIIQTIVLGGIGLLQLGAFICQAIYMRAAAHEMRQTTQATIQAAKATENSAKDALKHSHKIERAYISAGGFRRFIPQAESTGSREIRMIDSGKFEFDVNNYGKTPGTVFRIGWGFCEAGDIPDIEPVYHSKYCNSRINPGTSGLPFEIIDIPPDLINPAVYGRVYYETIFGDRFSSGFLYRIPPIWKGSESIAPPNPRYTDEQEED